ncbi:MAG: HD domain-containing protein [Clostridium butyricum]|nr:HD domain-containing protein [Clostridium butyricum]
MLSSNEIKEYLKNNLKEERYNHVLGVAETAKKLAKLNNVEEDIAEIAGLAHDVAKNMKIDEMKKIIDENNIILSDVEERSKNLWHSIIAPIVAREKLDIKDEEILSSLRWHTTGKENMTTLEKIIYIADMIEPTRDFPGIEELRDMTFDNLDEGVLAGLTHTMKFLLDKNILIDDNTMKARNYLLMYNK